MKTNVMNSHYALKFDPQTGLNYNEPYITAAKYRNDNPNGKWINNPWTGFARNSQDVMLDPLGLAIVPPGEPFYAAPTPVIPTPCPETQPTPASAPAIAIQRDPLPLAVWDTAPNWAMWHAQDANGNWYWYDNKPICQIAEWDAFKGDEIPAYQFHYATKPHTTDAWKHTLEKRPTQPATETVEERANAIDHAQDFDANLHFDPYADTDADWGPSVNPTLYPNVVNSPEDVAEDDAASIVIVLAEEWKQTLHDARTKTEQIEALKHTIAHTEWFKELDMQITANLKYVGEIAELQKQLKDAEDAIEVWRDANRGLKAELNDCGVKIFQLSEDNKRMARNLQECAAAVQNKSDSLKGDDAIIVNLQKELNDCEAKLFNQYEENKRFTRDLEMSGSTVQLLNKSAAETKQRLDLLRNENKKLLKLNEDKFFKNNDLKKQIEKLEEDNQNLYKKNEQLASECIAANNKLIDFNNLIESFIHGGKSTAIEAKLYKDNSHLPTSENNDAPMKSWKRMDIYSPIAPVIYGQEYITENTALTLHDFAVKWVTAYTQHGMYSIQEMQAHNELWTKLFALRKP